jgi:outer membrane protein OmpA-like peptidoglycan-associated protein
MAKNKNWIAPLCMAACGVAVLLSGCATTSPEGESALDQARAQVQRLEEQPLASQTAGKALQDARDALAAAEAAEREHKSADVVVHLAYLASRNADVGEAVLAEARARAAIAQAQAQRDRVLLDARERDAAAAHQQALLAQQSAQEAQAQAQASQQQAQESAQQAQDAQQQARDAQQQLEDMQAKQTDRGMMLTLGNVLFDSGGDTLKPGADELVSRLSQFLQNHSDIKVRIEGHTDSIGSDSYNEALSQRRAQAVATALESRGVPATRIEAVGRGKSAPVAGNDTSAGRQQNRRVEIIFSDAQGQFVSG